MVLQQDLIYEQQISRILKKSSLSKGQRDILFDYEQFLRAEGKRATTIKNKISSVDKIIEFCKKDFDKVTKKDLIGFCANLEKQHSGGTANLHRVETKGFFKWFYANYMKWKPKFKEDCPEVVSWIKNKNGSGKKTLPEELLTMEEIKKLVNVSTGYRNKSLIMCLYDSAGRISELLNLRIKNLVFDEFGGYLMVPHSKTGMRKIRLIDSIPYLKNYIDNEHPDKEDPNSYLFVGIEGRGSKIADIGKPISPISARIILKRLGKKAQIKKNIFPHLFRHTKLTEMAKDFSEQEMKIFAGWTGGSNMPQVYVHLSGEDVEKKILERNGLIKEEGKKKAEFFKPRLCITPDCRHENPATNKFCEKCHRPLEVKEIEKIEKAMYDMYKENQEKVETKTIEEQIKKLTHLIEKYEKTKKK